jgi:hypothetical protein
MGVHALRSQFRLISSDIPKVRILTIGELVAVYQDIYEESAGRVDFTRVQQMLQALHYRSCGTVQQETLLQHETWMAKLYQENVLFWAHSHGCWQYFCRLAAVDWQRALGEGVHSLQHHYEFASLCQVHRRSLLCRTDRVLVLESQTV